MHYFHTGLELHIGHLQDVDYGMYLDIVECYKESFYPDINISYDKFRKIFTKHGNVNSFYAIEGQIVATATGIIKDSIIHSGKLSMMIEDVCTKRDYRGCGYGSFVVSDLIKYAKEIDCYKIQLHASDKNTEFYRKLGFEIHNHHNMRIDL